MKISSINSTLISDVKLIKLERYERSDELPDFTDQAAFQSFMAEMFS